MVVPLTSMGTWYTPLTFSIFRVVFSLLDLPPFSAYTLDFFLPALEHDEQPLVNKKHIVKQDKTKRTLILALLFLE